MSELDAEVKEFFESNGEKAPVEQKEEPKVTKEEPKAEVKEEKKDEKSEKPEDKSDKPEEDDPHAENHRKALKEARAEMKRLKKERAESEEKREKELGEMREKFRLWTEAVNKQQEVKPPAFEEDPANHLKQEHEMTKKELTELRAWKQQQEQAYAQHQAMQQFQAKLRADEVEFSKVTPDYDQAAQFLAGIWQAELEISGVPQEHLANAYQFKVAQFANAAIRRGESPAEAAYELAQRIGYKKQEKEKPAAEKKIETIQKGMEASKSLGSGKSDAEFSLDHLKDMSPSEIDAFVANPKKWAKLG